MREMINAGGANMIGRAMGRGRVTMAMLIALPPYLIGCSLPYGTPPDLSRDAAATVVLEHQEAQLRRLVLEGDVSVQIHDSGDECPGFGGLGTPNYRGSVELRPLETRSIEVPAQHRMFFRMVGKQWLLGLIRSCEETIGWIPVAGGRYRLSYRADEDGCPLRVIDEAGGQPVRSYSDQGCR